MPKKIAPLDPVASQMTGRSDRRLVEVCGVVQMLGGVLAMVFNILFIYFGMLSGWYRFQVSCDWPSAGLL